MKNETRRFLSAMKSRFAICQSAINAKVLALWCGFVTIPAVNSFAQSVGKDWGNNRVNVAEWPWTKFLNSLAEQLTGPLPMILGILGIAAAAIGMFMGNHGAGMQKMLVLIFAVSICLFAPSFIQYISTGAGGVTIAGM